MNDPDKTLADAATESATEPAAQPGAAVQDDSLGAVLRRLGPAAILGGLWAVLPAVGGIALLYYINDVSVFLRGHEAVGIALYIAVFVLSAGFGLLPTYSQSALAGYAFGLTRGSLAALAGFTGASVVGYIIARTVARERMEKEIRTHPKARIVRDSLVGRGFWSTLGIVTLVRLPPNSPFALTNLVLAGAGVKLPVYVLGTLIGLAPRTIAAVYIASQFARASAADAAQAPKPVWWLPVNIAAAVVVVIVIGAIAKRALERGGRSSGGVSDAEDRAEFLAEQE